MALHRFTVYVRGADVLTPETAAALDRAGCDDAAFAVRDRAQIAEFTREAPTFAGAVGSAIDTIEHAVPGALVVRVAPDDLVSLTEIAARTGRTKESVRLYTEGRRGPGGFPAPLTWVARKHRLWQWSDVADWFASGLGERHQDEVPATFVAALNGALEVRWRCRQLQDPEERAVVSALLEQPVAFAREASAA